MADDIVALPQANICEYIPSLCFANISSVGLSRTINHGETLSLVLCHYAVLNSSVVRCTLSQFSLYLMIIQPDTLLCRIQGSTG